MQGRPNNGHTEPTAAGRDAGLGECVPRILDRAGGRRAGNRADFCDLVKLSHVLTAVQTHGGYPVEPVDLHPSIRHLVAFQDLLTLSTKVVNGYSLGAQRNLDCLEMVRIAPSASNKQPWRVVRDGPAWHFYCQRTPGSADAPMRSCRR